MADIRLIEVHSLASFVADEMVARSWTCVDVARKMPGEYGQNVAEINFFLAIDPSEILVDDHLINSLSAAFGLSTTFFRNLHQKWVDHPDVREPFDCPEELLDGLTFPAHH